MVYDPFARGPFPVGVRTVTLTRNRELPAEIWYPAAGAYAGQDQDDATRDRFRQFEGAPEQVQDAVRDAAPREDRFPLVVYSHGALGSRYHATFLSTHLASHGYVVAAPDHTGNTAGDQAAMLAGTIPPPDPMAPMYDRPLDLHFTIEAVRSGSGELAGQIDPGPVGAMGLSFGGWTALMAGAHLPRIGAVFAMAPGWGKGPLGEGNVQLEAALDLSAWTRRVPTLLLVAERDALVILPEMRRLYGLLPEPKQLVVLADAGHVHFVDGIAAYHDELVAQMQGGALNAPPELGIDFAAIAEAMGPSSALLAEAPAHDATRALGLAHFDATLKGNSEAAGFLANGLAAALAAHGARVEVG